MKKEAKKKPSVKQVDSAPSPVESVTTITIPKLPITRKHLIIAIAVLFVGAMVYAYRTSFSKAQLLAQSAGASKEKEDILAKVEQIIDVPQSESPRIGTVTDPAKLASQPFFKDAQKGDKVLIYENADKVILYRPSTNKVIGISSLKDDMQTATKKTAATPTTSPKNTPSTLRITVLNGTDTVGLAAATADKVKEQFSYAEIVNTGNTEGSYKDTIVIDLTGKRKSEAQEIAAYLKGKFGALPQEESKPADTDVVVIISE